MTLHIKTILHEDSIQVGTMNDVKYLLYMKHLKNQCEQTLTEKATGFRECIKMRKYQTLSNCS